MKYNIVVGSAHVSHSASVIARPLNRHLPNDTRLSNTPKQPVCASEISPGCGIVPLTLPVSLIVCTNKNNPENICSLGL